MMNPMKYVCRVSHSLREKLHKHHGTIMPQQDPPQGQNLSRISIREVAHAYRVQRTAILSACCPRLNLKKTTVWTVEQP
jgi:hypothetical protein